MNALDIIATIPRATLAAFSAALGEVPQNSNAWTYTIFGFDKSPYLTRTLLPRIGGRRALLHRIWREDADPYMHNHPWKTARFLIVSGGYIEERLIGEHIETRVLKPGDVNELDASTFHRVTTVKPHTWTLGIVGERVQDWGFLVCGEFVASAEYFARKGHVAETGAGRS